MAEGEAEESEEKDSPETGTEMSRRDWGKMTVASIIALYAGGPLEASTASVTKGAAIAKGVNNPERFGRMLEFILNVGDGVSDSISYEDGYTPEGVLVALDDIISHAIKNLSASGAPKDAKTLQKIYEIKRKQFVEQHGLEAYDAEQQAKKQQRKQREEWRAESPMGKIAEGYGLAAEEHFNEKDKRRKEERERRESRKHVDELLQGAEEAMAESPAHRHKRFASLGKLR